MLLNWCLRAETRDQGWSGGDCLNPSLGEQDASPPLRQLLSLTIVYVQCLQGKTTSWTVCWQEVDRFVTRRWSLYHACRKVALTRFVRSVGYFAASHLLWHGGAAAKATGGLTASGFGHFEALAPVGASMSSMAV